MVILVKMSDETKLVVGMCMCIASGIYIIYMCMKPKYGTYKSMNGLGEWFIYTLWIICILRISMFIYVLNIN